jgi:hypothetical protein
MFLNFENEYGSTSVPSIALVIENSLLKIVTGHILETISFTYRIAVIFDCHVEIELVPVA